MDQELQARDGRQHLRHESYYKGKELFFLNEKKETRL